MWHSPGGSGLGKVIGGVQVLPAGAIGPDGRAAIIRDPTLTSPTEPTPPAPHLETGGVEGAAAHPYAKVKKNHPYAHVKLPKSECSKSLCCSLHPPSIPGESATSPLLLDYPL